jgi:hypothetical protein
MSRRRREEAGVLSEGDSGICGQEGREREEK